MYKPTLISEKDNTGREFVKAWRESTVTRWNKSYKVGKAIVILTDISDDFNPTVSFENHPSITLSLLCCRRWSRALIAIYMCLSS